MKDERPGVDGGLFVGCINALGFELSVGFAVYILYHLFK